MVTQSLRLRALREAIHDDRHEGFDPNAVIASYTSVLNRAVGTRIPVITRLNPDIGQISACRKLFEQTLLLLAVNARDAMPQGGIIVIETSRVDLNDVDALADCHARLGTYVRVTIRDTGCRLSSSTVPAAANSPSGIRRIGHEIGAGIRKLETLLSDCEGFLTVDSYPGAGSTFSLHFPELKQFSVSV